MRCQINLDYNVFHYLFEQCNFKRVYHTRLGNRQLPLHPKHLNLIFIDVTTTKNLNHSFNKNVDLDLR
jgi:hypothetical protein